MNNYLLPFFALIFFACNTKNQKTDATDKKENTSTATQQNESVVGTPVFTVLPFDKNDQTFKDSIKGEIVAGFNWRDTESHHRVLFTTSPVKLNKSGQQSGAIFVYCFFQKGGNWQKKWEVKDRIDNCEVDATCEFFPGSFTITDNDGNNFGEVCFLYKLSCRGDASPDEKKLIMYEGMNKYAIRGSTTLQFSEGKEGGDKKTDASFSKADKPLLDFANSQWDKFGTTKY